MFWNKKKIAPPSSSDKIVTFEFFNTTAKQVYLSGDFNCWDLKSCPLTRDQTGRWKASISLAPGRYEYRFFVDGQWCNDQRPVYLVENSFGSQNCLIEV